jgi:actin-related protein 5
MSTPWIDRPNVVSRYRDRKVGRNTLLFGQDVEVDANSRSNGRSMYDGDMLIHSDLLVSCARWKES